MDDTCAELSIMDLFNRHPTCNPRQRFEKAGWKKWEVADIKDKIMQEKFKLVNIETYVKVKKEFYGIKEDLLNKIK